MGFSELTVILQQSNGFSHHISKLYSSFKLLSKFRLSLGQMDLVLGELCGLNENRNINPDVDHCCKTNFAFRRPCFEGLEADKTYKPPCTPQDLFVFHTDLCQSHNEELQRKKDRYKHSLPFTFFFSLKAHHVLTRRHTVIHRILVF